MNANCNHCGQSHERIAMLEATLRGLRKMLEVPVCGWTDLTGVIDGALGLPRIQPHNGGGAYPVKFLQEGESNGR